jgi:CheY-like chemotaxis protein
MPIAAAAWRVDARGALILAAANPAASRLYGADLSALVGQPFTEIFAAASLPEVLNDTARAQATTHLSPLAGPDGRAYAAEVIPLGGGAVGAIFTEVALYGSLPPASTRGPGSTRRRPATGDEAGSAVDDGGSPERNTLPPRTSRPPGPASTRAGARSGRILVIDDEPLVGRLVERALGRGHQVTVVVTGRDGLERIVAGERFDLILCDLMMPELTGMDLYEHVAALSTEQAERMVFLTGGAFTRRARDFLENRPFLEKPFDLSALEALVRERLG